MMKVKILKTEEDYDVALARLKTLMNAKTGTPEGEELELLALLIEKYEDEHYPIELPDPIEAIKFRMEQQGLSKKDMQKYLGSQSKVSEVLNNKRPLSLSMIRALVNGLGIPAEVLLQEPDAQLPENEYQYTDYPFNEMVKKKFFDSFTGSLTQAKENAEELLGKLFSVFDGDPPKPVLCRHGKKEVNIFALTAWHARALQLAMQEEIPSFDKKNFSKAQIKQIIHLSSSPKDLKKVKPTLNNLGIHFIILPHLEKTYLDGACFYTQKGNPVVAMTLRYDRLDNFWFTLVHELAHIHLHLDGKDTAIFDNTEDKSIDNETPYEKEADELTQELLISPEIWAHAENLIQRIIEDRNEVDVKYLAEKLDIHPAIVAGRISWENQDYRILHKHIGRNMVRSQLQFSTN